MAGLFQPKRVQVPGLLSDDGLTAALSNLTATTKAVGAKAPPNTSAVDAADSIFKEALKAEPGLRNVKPRVPGTEMKVSADTRSTAMGKGISDAVQATPILSQVASAVVGAGTLSPEDQISEQKIIVDELKQKEQTVKDAQALGEMMNKGFESQPLDPEVLPLALEREAKRRRDLIEAGQDVAAAEKILPTQAWWLNAVQTGTRSALDMGVGTFRAPADLWDTVATIATKGLDAKVEKSDVSVWVDGIDKALTNMLPGDKARSKQFVTELAAGTGSMTGFMIAGWAGKAVGLPAGAVTATLGALTEADSMYQDADGFSANATQKFIALMAGAGLGTTEAIPIDRMFMRADVGTGGMIRRLLENTTAGSLEEFIQEASQSLGEDIVAKYAYDPSRKIDPVKAFESGLIGGITGGATASVTTVLSGNNEIDPVKMDEVQQTEAVDAALEEESRRFAAIIGDEAVDLGDDGQGGMAAAPAGANESALGGSQAAVARPDPVVVDGVRGDAVQQIATSPAIEQTQANAPREPGFTQLSAAQRETVATPEFKTWFADSAVTERKTSSRDTGAVAPLVVYHGTQADIQAFDPTVEGTTTFMGIPVKVQRRGMFFAEDPAFAQTFAEQGAGKGKGRILPVFLSIQNPLDLSGEQPSPEDAQKLIDAGVDERFVKDYLGDPRSTWEAFEADNADEFVAQIKQAGFDGVRMKEIDPAEQTADGNRDVWIAFEPTQIKSAIANNGAFDPTNPNIDQQVADPVADPIAAAVQSAQPEASELEPLPNHEKKTSGPVPMVVKAARAYAAATGMPLRRQREYVKVDVARAARIAQAYADMKHDPNDPAVAAAYKALADETKAQYRYVLATGLEIESMKEGQPDPYPEGPGKHVREDLLNGHLWYYPTKFGFGSDASFDPSTNPLLEETEFKNDAGETMLVNDLFRVVHDFFGHGMEGAGFGARGEENAWQAHMRLFSESAIPAMTSETRGQNRWVNYGPFGAANRADPKNTVYADQKTGIMPSWTWQEGVEDTAAYGISAPVEMTTPEPTTDPAPGRAALQIGGQVFTAKTHADALLKAISAFGETSAEIAAFEAAPESAIGEWNDKAVTKPWGEKLKAGFTLTGTSGDGGVAVRARLAGGKRGAASTFRDALLAAKAASKHGAVVRAYTVAEYAKMRLFLAPDGKAGFALKGDDIVSVFSQGGGRLRSIMDTALANGGQRLDAFDGFLPKAYARLGFRETSRVPWDESPRPEGWTDDMGTPDVVFMEYASSDIDLSVASYGTATKEFMDWDDGAAIRYIKENGYGDDRADAGGLGTPLVLYSGAPHNLRVATRSMWLTPDRGTAENFGSAPSGVNKNADAEFDEDGNNIGGSVFTFHARMENPYEYNWDGRMWSDGPETEYPTVYVVDGDNYSSYADAQQAVSDAQDSARSTAEEDFRDDMANRLYVAPLEGADGTTDLFGTRFEVRLKLARESVGDLEFRVRNATAYLADRVQALAAAEKERDANTGSALGSEYHVNNMRRQRDTAAQQLVEFETKLVEARTNPPQDEVLNTFDTEEEARDFENTYTEEGAIAAGDEAADAVDTNISEDYDYESSDSGQTTDSVVQYAVSAGYDGVIFRDVDEGNGPVDVYVVITPGNAKSTANLGQWDRENPDILRMTGTATMRAPFKAEQTRPTKGIATPSPDPGNQEDVRLSKISRDFVTLLKLTARHGRLASKGSAVMGEYHRRAATIRLRTWTDLSTLVHEGGHAINDSMSAPMNAFVQANITAINDIAHTYYPGDLSKAPGETVRREGFAEFFRVYTLNPAHARTKWPQLVTSFETVLKQEDPKILDGLNSISASFSAWLQLPSRQLIRNMVIDGRREQGINAAVKELREQGFKTWMHEHARRSTEWLINRYASIADLETQLLNLAEKNRGAPIELNRSDSPTTIMRLARNAGSRAQVQITDGIIGYRSTMSSSRGLREALMTALKVNPDTTPASLDEELMKDFDAYLIARRAFDEYRRFDLGEIERPPIGAQKGDVIRAIKEYEKTQPQFTAAAAIVHDYGMAMWQKRYDAGLMDKETYEEGLQRQFYAPLQRDVSDKQGSGADSLHFGSSVLTKGPRFKGSDRDIISPMTVLMQMTFALEKQIAENDAKKALAVLADRAGQAGALVERIPASQLIGQSFSVQQVAQRLTADSGLTAADASDLLTILGGSIDKGDMMTLFRSEQAGTQGENVLFFWENGKVAAIRLNDSSLAADVVNTMNAVGRENMDLLLEGVAATSTVFRTAITSWPDFLMINYIRDQFSAWILTDVGYTPFVTGLGGIADEIRQKQWAKSYNAAGGILGGMNVAALHTARVDRDIRSLRAKGYIANVFGDMNGGWSNVPGAIKGLARLTAITETGTRLGIYKKAYQRAIADGLSEYDASVEAAYIATDYIDFGLNGNKMLTARRTIPFLNAQLQGLYKMVRTLGGDEAARRKGLKFALGAFFKSTKNLPLSRTEKQAIRTGRAAWLKMMSLGLISAALWAVFKDDPDYEEAGEYLRTTGWVIPMGNGKIAYIPKPFELAMIANAVERGLEFASGDATAVDRFKRGVAFALTPPTAPPAIQSMVEVAANYDFFTGTEIVPNYMKALDPQLQYDNYTSSIAKWVGKATGLSPLVVDHVLSGMGASAYRDISTMINAADPTRPAPDETDMPIIRRFVRDVRRGSASAQDFWAQASNTNGKMAQGAATYKKFMEMGNEPAANRFLSTLDADRRAYAVLMTDFKPEEKRLNPFYRARQVTTIVSGMRRENGSELGLGDTSRDPVVGEGPLILPQMSRGVRAQVDDILSEIARREVRNTMIATEQPGWKGKDILPLEPTLDLLLAISPDTYDEYNRRRVKAKVYDAQSVFDYWPEVRDRLVQDGPDAILSDAVAIAGVVF